MAFLDWMKRGPARRRHDDTRGGWKAVGVYFYRTDGRYPVASWAETPERFEKMIPQIRDHLNKKLEVRIVNTQDHLLFHATDKGIEWDGIGLTPLVQHERRNTHGMTRDEFPDR